ncbi:hypothetical protein VTK56DRAFT_8413 [Thermocarpiscus australiensis]
MSFPCSRTLYARLCRSPYPLLPPAPASAWQATNSGCRRLRKEVPRHEEDSQDAEDDRQGDCEGVLGRREQSLLLLGGVYRDGSTEEVELVSVGIYESRMVQVDLPLPTSNGEEVKPTVPSSVPLLVSILWWWKSAWRRTRRGMEESAETMVSRKDWSHVAGSGLVCTHSRRFRSAYCR